MSEIVLKAEVRKEVGSFANRVRFEGKVPGVFYAHGEENINLTVTAAAIKPLIYTSDTHIVNLQLDNGTSKTCILRDVQFHPLTDKAIHFDLQGVKEDEELAIEVPVVITGSPKGVKDGGTLQLVIHKLKVQCLPKYIPENVKIDVSDLGINESVHVRDLPLPNVTVLENAASTVVAVVPPTVVKEAEAGAPGAAVEGAAASAEPEVITKGKKPAEEA
ncbi:MAG TPA: 50S ribosomal protein L25 [Bacteroidota bacterium]|nr:50S ribosomal protein L25 [Bacteroidota bacterium]